MSQLSPADQGGWCWGVTGCPLSVLWVTVAVMGVLLMQPLILRTGGERHRSGISCKCEFGEKGL